MYEFQPYSRVRIGGFWEDKQQLVRDVTIPYQWDALNDRVPGADRSGAVKNFKIAAGKAKGAFQGFFFQDSDLAKWIEAAAYALASRADPTLERNIDRLIETIVAAQDEDGYLNTYYTVAEKPDLRWTDLRDKHELYVAGHLLEAGIAYYGSTGKRALLDAAIRNIDLIAQLFGRGRGQRRGYPGHPEIELALMRLYEVTGNARHLQLAKYFIDERGASPRYFDRETKRLGKKDFRSDEWYAIYNQSHLPIREQKEIVGHAVRACYLFAAAADVARETNDRELFRSVKRLWKNATERRMYLTGGVGSTLLGEAFTFDYDLPNEWAYTETCAAIALVFWSRRMLETEADSRYADVMERVLYNGYLSALSTEGKHCFYRNPLASVPDPKYPKRHIRRAWHECACCPPNVSRLMMSLGGYVYAHQARSVFAHLYVDSETSFEMGDVPVHISQKTRYPWEGTVEFVLGMPADTRFKLCLRIPSWARSWTVALNAERLDREIPIRNGYACIDRVWTNGDRLELELPMPVERVYSHPKVRQDAGQVALQRGPIVYCFEQADNGPDLHEIVLPSSSEFQLARKGTVLGGIPVITTAALRSTIGDAKGPLYGVDADRRDRSVEVTAVPYFLWANRGMGEMRVWVRD